MPPQASHLLGFLLILLVIVIIVSLVLLLLLRFLDLAQGLPLGCKRICLSLVIADNNVVENRATLDLPQIETDESKIGILVHRVIIFVLWVVDLLRLPEALVRWIRDALYIPIALVGCVVLHGRLPLAILLINPIIWLLVTGIIHHGILHPIPC